MNDNTSLDILPGNWARLKLVPLAREELNIYCKYPTGSTDLLLTNYVEKVWSYKTCYQAGLEGDYEVLYTVDRGPIATLSCYTSSAAWYRREPRLHHPRGISVALRHLVRRIMHRPVPPLASLQEEPRISIASGII